MSATQFAQGSVVVADTGGSLSIKTPTTGKRLRVTGFSLTVTANTTAATLLVRFASTTFGRMVFNPIGTLASTGYAVQPGTPWTVTGIMAEGAASENLNISYTGTNAQVDGMIFWTEEV